MARINSAEYGSVAKKQITLLPTIIRLNFSQRRFACSTKGVYIFQAVAFLNATLYLAFTLDYRDFNDGVRMFFSSMVFYPFVA
ncbi:hypothetical protein BMR02_12975 [Methylococcaceae bacterium HT1]|nr:hypothetical protein BMR02_12975 [Methylococcaceae bacterium HT1]